MTRVNIASLNINIAGNSKGLNSALNRSIADIQNFGREANSVGSQIIGLKNSVIGLVAATGALRGLDAVKDIAVKFVVDSVGLAAELETVTLQFETILKDADAAKELIKEIQGFANATPFASADLTDASKQLLAYGFAADEILPTLVSIGDIAAASGASLGDLAEIYGRIYSDNRAQAEDLNRLNDRAIPIYRLLADQLGVNTQQVRKLASEGKIGFREIQQAFADLTSASGDFGGATEKLSKSVSGKLSTLSDSVTELYRNFGENLTPATQQSIDLMLELAAAANELSTAMGSISNLGILSLTESIKQLRMQLPLATLGVKQLLAEFGLIAPLDMQKEAFKVLDMMAQINSGRPKESAKQPGIESIIGKGVFAELDAANEELNELVETAQIADQAIGRTASRNSSPYGSGFQRNSVEAEELLARTREVTSGAKENAALEQQFDGFIDQLAELVDQVANPAAQDGRPGEPDNAVDWLRDVGKAIADGIGNMTPEQQRQMSFDAIRDASGLNTPEKQYADSPQGRFDRVDDQNAAARESFNKTYDELSTILKSMSDIFRDPDKSVGREPVPKEPKRENQKIDGVTELSKTIEKNALIDRAKSERMLTLLEKIAGNPVNIEVIEYLT
jgi:tape measure domain-containing protein